MIDIYFLLLSIYLMKVLLLSLLVLLVTCAK